MTMKCIWILLICTYILINIGLYDAASHNRAVLSNECCLCDDASPDFAKRCSTPDVCRSNFMKCPYCRTTKLYTNNAWVVKRDCGDVATCQSDYYTTLSEPSCGTGASQPTDGAACYYCCRNNNPFTPFYCRDSNPETVFTKFNVTTSTAPPTTPTTPTTTTQSTTTTSTTQAPITSTLPTTTTVATTQASKGQYCMVGDGNFTLQRCPDNMPMCMNTVVVTPNFTIQKKSCESAFLCDHDWENDTKLRPDCLETNVTALVPSSPGLVCHYCCRSVPSTGAGACNQAGIPTDVQQYVAHNVIHGGWSSWSPWQGCSPTCAGIQGRVRTCDNPWPNSLGKTCRGQGFQELDCGPSNCKVTGTGTPTLVG